MKEYLDMFLTFFRIGAITFGGGYAMLPFLQSEIVEKKQWATEAEIMDYYAIGQCTPGVIAVNVATFVGQKYKGNLGGVVSTLGVVAPSVVIISFIAAVLTNFAEVAWVQNALGGVRVCVCVFIFNAVLKLIKSAVVDKATAIMYGLLFALALFTGISPIIPVLIAGICGLILTKAGVRGK